MPFEGAARARAKTVRLFGKAVSLPTAEDLILFKVVAGRDKDIVDAVGVARRHDANLDRRHLQDTLRPICDLAEDMTPWRRLGEVLAKAATP